MKKIITSLILLLVALTGYLGYRGYRDYQAELAASLKRQRMMADQASLQEQNRLVEAAAEAHRLAELQARQTANKSAAELKRLQVAQAAAVAARQVAELERDRLQAEADQLRQTKEAAQAEARRLAALRESDAVEAMRAREAALAKLQAMNEEKRQEVDRAAARLAALRAQQVRETELTKLRPPRARIIQPFDYKPRDHQTLRSILEWESYEKELAALQESPKSESSTDLPK